MATSLAEAIKRAKEGCDAATARSHRAAEETLRRILSDTGLSNPSDCVDVAPGEWVLFNALRVRHSPFLKGAHSFILYRDREGKDSVGHFLSAEEFRFLLVGLAR